MAGEEDAGEEGISADPDAKGYDYSTLWKAMQDDEEDEDKKDDDESDEDDGDGGSEGDEGAMEGVEEDMSDVDNDVPADINAHALASESSGNSGDSDAQEDTSEDEGEWVMATRLVGPPRGVPTPAAPHAAVSDDEEDEVGGERDAGGSSSQFDSSDGEGAWLVGGEEGLDSDAEGGDVFAAAEEYDAAIAADLAGEPPGARMSVWGGEQCGCCVGQCCVGQCCNLFRHSRR